jgi:hypothetical protein
MTRGFRGRLHPRHVRTIHNPSQRQSQPRTSTEFPIIWDAAKLLQTTSLKRQRGMKLWRKIQLTTKKVVLLVLWRR